MTRSVGCFHPGGEKTGNMQKQTHDMFFKGAARVPGERLRRQRDAGAAPNITIIQVIVMKIIIIIMSMVIMIMLLLLIITMMKHTFNNDNDKYYY